MDRELLADLIMVVTVLALVGLALHARHTSRDRKATRQRERERELRADRKADQANSLLEREHEKGANS